MLNSTGPPTAGPPVLVPDHVSAEANRLPDMRPLKPCIGSASETAPSASSAVACVLPRRVAKSRELQPSPRQLRRRSILLLSLARGADHVVYWKDQDGRRTHISGGAHSGSVRKARCKKGCAARSVTQINWRTIVVCKLALMAAGWRARRVTCEDSSAGHSGVVRMANLVTRTGDETCGRQILEILFGRRWSFSTAISGWLSAC
jgi:hypothetical protein